MFETKTLKIGFDTRNARKQEAQIRSEDAWGYSLAKTVFVVTDGVTRDSYPIPGNSIAKRAAHVAMAKLLDAEKIGIEAAFREANQAVQDLNQQEGLWNDHNYLGRDLAGCCAAVAVRRDNFFTCGVVGDCRVAKLVEGQEIQITTDLVALARQEFPSSESMSVQERKRIIRGSRRNNPTDAHRTYGVLTGEPNALHPRYLVQTSFALKPGEAMAIFSDGITPLLDHEPQLKSLLISASVDDIENYIQRQRLAQDLEDEITLIVYRA